MGILKYIDNKFEWHGSFEEKHLAEDAGFEGFKDGIWSTSNPFKAVELAAYSNYACSQQLNLLYTSVYESKMKISFHQFPKPDGMNYYPFQRAAIHTLSTFPFAMLADDMGLGKTISAIGVANTLKYCKLLVICPASLRLNWERELKKWHMWNPGIDVVLDKNKEIDYYSTVVISYEMAVKLYNILKYLRFDMAIVDECHQIKSSKAKRTKTILGTPKQDGLLSRCGKALFLTGTPLTNNPMDLYPILSRTVPHIIDGMEEDTYLRYYCKIKRTGWGIKIVGTKNEVELHNRLRSGFMIRRLKKDVLPQLPDKQFNMIVFPKNKDTIKVLKQEKEFDYKEILESNKFVGSALPQIRREMGLAKLPDCIEYIENMLANGVKKIIVFAWHTDVIEVLWEVYKDIAVKLTGKTVSLHKDVAIETFQNAGNIKIFIGNIKAAGEGITLTSSHEVVFVESSWTPRENDQAIDRAHRIGQNEKVNIHYLVVEDSLDFHILSTVAKKRNLIEKIIDGS